MTIGVYNWSVPQKNERSFLEKISNELNELIKKYENLFFLGDFNMTPENVAMKEFLSTHDFENLVKSPTCFKGSNPRCIDLLLTNQSQLFMKTILLLQVYLTFMPPQLQT